MYFSKVFIFCPANVTTGGPELLHQFASKLQEKGVTAFVVYYPFEAKADTPEQYRHYQVRVGAAEQIDSRSLVILPETATKISGMFSNNNVAIWWLSVDNYFGCPPNSYGIKKIKHLIAMLCRKKMAIRKMGNFIHLHQSEYARALLAENSIDSMQLTDYLSITHFESKMKLDISNKEKIITYNPKKGFEITQKLINKLPFFKFIPLINMSSTEVSETLSKAMIYIDFGNHPGKDRLPREAALANCCIITGKRGSAKNSIDLSIPERFKIDEHDSGFIHRFQHLCDDIFNDFQSEWYFFESYRNSIYYEPMCFDKNVEVFIDKYIRS